jgi:hypothetical protein
MRLAARRSAQGKGLSYQGRRPKIAPRIFSRLKWTSLKKQCGDGCWPQLQTPLGTILFRGNETKPAGLTLPGTISHDIQPAEQQALVDSYSTPSPIR